MKHLKTSFIYGLFPLFISFLPYIYGAFAKPEDYLLVKAFDLDVLLFYLPLSYAILSFLFGWRKGFSLIFPVISLLMFVPVIIWAYTYHAAGTEIYLLIYGIISLVFMFLGWGIKRLLQKNRKNT